MAPFMVMSVAGISMIDVVAKKAIAIRVERSAVYGIVPIGRVVVVDNWRTMVNGGGIAGLNMITTGNS
jgi:hypothetical protein